VNACANCPVADNRLRDAGRRRFARSLGMAVFPSPNGRTVPRARAQARRQLLPLTSLRFFACFAVFLHHCVDFTSPAGDTTHHGLYGILWQGWSGVSFFFVLSGFILAYTYRDRLTRADGPALRGFYASRIARIYPLGLATFLVAAVALGAQWARAGIAGVATAAAQLTLTQAWLPFGDPFAHGRLAALGFDGPAWSLSCEAFFYLLFPFLLVTLARRRAWQLGIVAAEAWGWALMLAFELRGSTIAGWALYIFPPVRLAEFVVGVCAGLVFLELGERVPGGGRLWTALEAGSLALLGGAVAASSMVATVLLYATYYVPFFALVIAVFAVGRGRLSQLLHTRALVLAGEVSFAIYLIQVLILRAAVWLGLFDGRLPSTLVLAGVFAATFAVSTAVHLRFERPMRGWARRRLDRPAASPVPAAAALAVAGRRPGYPSPGIPGAATGARR